MKRYALMMLVAIVLVACDDIFDFDYQPPHQIDAEALVEDLNSGVLSVKDLDWGNVLLRIDGKWKPLPADHDGLALPKYLFYPDGKLWYCYAPPAYHITEKWSYDAETATLHTNFWNGAGEVYSMRVASYNPQTGEIDLEGSIVDYHPFGCDAIRLRGEIRAQDRDRTINMHNQPHPDYDQTDLSL